MIHSDWLWNIIRLRGIKHENQPVTRVLNKIVVQLVTQKIESKKIVNRKTTKNESKKTKDKCKLYNNMI